MNGVNHFVVNIFEHYILSFCSTIALRTTAGQYLEGGAHPRFVRIIPVGQQHDCQLFGGTNAA
jgi:hypothetical protein